jgi:hypothetical protein
MSAAQLGEVAEAARAEWVSKAALERLEELGLGERALERIMAWLLAGRIRTPSAQAASPLVAAAIEVLEPSAPAAPGDVARLSERLYRQHSTMLRVGGKPWLERLDGLAAAPPPAGVRDLTDVLRERLDAQWLILDCLGLPLLGTLRAHLESLLPAWRLEKVEFALVSETTTTEACYRQLIEAGFNHPLEKINCVDALLHERFLPLDDLSRLVAAELSIACGRMRKRLDPGLPLVVFADHGFRLAPDGRSYTHGGASPLERLVPVLDLAVA